MKKKYILLVTIFLINIVCIYSITNISKNKIMTAETEREQLDLDTIASLQKIIQKQVNDENVNGNIAVWFHSKDIIRLNMGKNDKINYTALKNGFPDLIRDVIQDLEQYQYIYSSSGRLATEGIYIYIDQNYTVKMQIEAKEDVPQKCIFSDDEFVR